MTGLLGWRSDPDAGDEDRQVDLAAQGVRSVEWLVHPSNLTSIAFSRSVFPQADETYPPEDNPYVSFALGLSALSRAARLCTGRFEHGICPPSGSGSGMTDDDFNRVLASIGAFLNR